MSQYIILGKGAVIFVALLLGGFALSGLFANDAFAACGPGATYESCYGDSSGSSNTGDGSKYSNCGPGATYESCYGDSSGSSSSADDTGYSDCGLGAPLGCEAGRSSSYSLNSTQLDAANRTLSDVARTLNSLRVTPTTTPLYTLPDRDTGSTGSPAGTSAGGSASGNLTAQDKQEIIDTLRALVKELSEKLEALERAQGASQ